MISPITAFLSLVTRASLVRLFPRSAIRCPFRVGKKACFRAGTWSDTKPQLFLSTPRSRSLIVYKDLHVHCPRLAPNRLLLCARPEAERVFRSTTFCARARSGDETSARVITFYEKTCRLTTLTTATKSVRPFPETRFT